MKLTVFGASGRTGRTLVEQALEKEHQVTAFIRDPAKLGIVHERLTIAPGDVKDYVIIAVFYAVENWLKDQQPSRQRGPKPKLSDSEALSHTMGDYLCQQQSEFTSALLGTP